MALTMEESAARAGYHCWFERRMFAVLGGWVQSVPEPAAKLLLDRHSAHHAWRAAQWWDRLPVLAGVDRDALVVAPDPATGAFADALADTATTVARLAGAYRVALPRLSAAYRAHRSSTSPVTDGPTIRVLDLLGPDVEGDWRDGEVLIQQLLTDTAAVEEASATVGRLEAILVAGPTPRGRPAG